MVLTNQEIAHEKYPYMCANNSLTIVDFYDGKNGVEAKLKAFNLQLVENAYTLIK